MQESIKCFPQMRYLPTYSSELQIKASELREYFVIDSKKELLLHWL